MKINGNEVRVENRDYLYLAENDRLEYTKEVIDDTYVYFNNDFLSKETDLPEEVFDALEAKGDNKTVKKLIEKFCPGGIDGFVEDAVRYDGYGHFISYYDGNEIVIDNKLGLIYLYRQN